MAFVTLKHKVVLHSTPLFISYATIKRTHSQQFGATPTSKNFQEFEISTMIQKMKKTSSGQVIGYPVKSVSYSSEETSRELVVHNPKSLFKQEKGESLIKWMSKFSKKADSYVQGIREHVNLSPKITKAVKGKLSLGARILQAGGVEKYYRQAFSVNRGEKLLKASQCYLSTTAGPIAGMLFISNEKIAFHSERSLTLTSPKGISVRIPYKVVIPLDRIERAVSSENSVKLKQKYVQIVTVDEFEFWFMGFVSHQKIFKYLQKIVMWKQ